ncbi:MAG: isoprenylcysteine carboxylmethyltransferase family protein [Verrucomicrobia bacterium]|nr:isoprenylcysteine carboxylmethyltransferase family protein [Verrucomicrobiota bacterium]
MLNEDAANPARTPWYDVAPSKDAVTETIEFIKWCWWVFLVVWLVAALRIKPTKERQSRGSQLIISGLVLIGFLLLAGKIRWMGLTSRVLPDTLAVRLAGDGITFIGLMTAVWARVILGGNWSSPVTFKEGHELVERGPYRWVRHPIYSGLLLMILGTACGIGRIGGFVGLILCFLGMWRKLRLEEALLTRHFPESYPKYMTRTKALIPYVL